MSANSAVLRIVKRLLVLTVLLSLLWAPNAARASTNLNWHGGQIANFIVDLIFYGNNFTTEDRDNAQEYMLRFTKYINGQYNPPGEEPAIHYYVTVRPATS